MIATHAAEVVGAVARLVQGSHGDVASLFGRPSRNCCAVTPLPHPRPASAGHHREFAHQTIGDLPGHRSLRSRSNFWIAAWCRNRPCRSVSAGVAVFGERPLHRRHAARGRG
jgi:hypothetical protein